MNPELLEIEGPSGPLSAELMIPERAHTALVFAHGAGAGFQHPTMVGICEALAAVQVATLRFNFPYMQAGRRRVDARAVAVAAIGVAARTAAARLPALRLCLGGHSFGGRMASHAVAEGRVAARALIFGSFPLHPANRPGVERAAHLRTVAVPMLFLSGTRDALAESQLLKGVVDELQPRATLHWLDDADHGYKARKRVRQDPRPVFDEMADTVAAFLDRLP